jgi:dihydroneopterin aldolase
LGVEIVRSRAQMQADQLIDERPHPRLVYLSNDAIASPHLSGWIDQLEGRERPLILCVGAPDLPAPQTGHKMTQRRIDLLAIEQNAWMLAARDPRCVVVSTRTELDWAMKNGQISVWAPSKIVLDAVDGPSAHPRDAVALAAWFAATFSAGEMMVIGAALPSDAKAPLRAVDVDQAQL